MSFFERLFAISPVRKFIWRCWYPFLTRRLRDKRIFFLNYAFETDPPLKIRLDDKDEPDRACIQLYHHVATQIPLEGKNVLEVSCGHGGGAAWISRTLNPACYLATDLNPIGISFCQRHHICQGLNFQQADAQSLPCPNNSVDVVINVEASHCYPDFPGFLQEVCRVLKPGGHFLYADFRFVESLPAWEQAITDSGLICRSSQDISAQVLRGMDCNAERSQHIIHQCLPKPLHPLGLDFAGVPGSRIYETLKSGQLTYRSWCLQRRDDQEI